MNDPDVGGWIMETIPKNDRDSFALLEYWASLSTGEYANQKLLPMTPGYLRGWGWVSVKVPFTKSYIHLKI